MNKSYNNLQVPQTVAADNDAGEVTRALTHLNFLLGSLRSAAGHLEDKLAVVLGAPTPAPDAPKHPPCESALGVTVVDYISQVSDLVHQLESLHSRIKI